MVKILDGFVEIQAPRSIDSTPEFVKDVLEEVHPVDGKHLQMTLWLRLLSLFGKLELAVAH